MFEETGDNVVDFANELGQLVKKYRLRLMSNAEGLGVLKMMSDDISERARKEYQNPNELS